MRNKNIRRYLLLFLSIMMVLPVLQVFVMPVRAEEVVTGPAADTQRSMLKFFRDANTGLNVKQTSQSEVMVYGVFLSNFFTPGKTTIKDLSKESGSDLADRVSTKFFGSNGNAEVVGELNDVIYRGITSVMSTDKKSFAMKTSATATTAMTGKDLLDKIKSPNDKNVYVGSNVVWRMSENSVQAAMQLLFGYSPELMLGENGWLLNATGLYMDGLGNVWANYKQGANDVDVDSYVLVMPAAMNPTTFSGSGDMTGTGVNFPVANVFAMGAAVGIKEDYAQGANPFTPYYNIKDMFTMGSETSNRNVNNLVGLVGVESWNKMDSSGLGQSDTIITNGQAGFDISAVKSFLNKTGSSTYDSKLGRIFITTDISKITSTKFFMNTSLASTEDDRVKLHNYFMNTRVIKADNVADRMYYFNYGDTGSFSGDDNEPLIREQRFFSKKADDSTYTFYDGAYFSSPFNTFLKTFFDSSNKDDLLKAFIKDYGNKKDVSADSEAFKALKTFLSTGYFTEDKTPVKTSVVDDALGLLGNTLTLGMLPQSTSAGSSKIKDVPGWQFWNSDKYQPTGYMLGFDDLRIAAGSINEGKYSGYRKPSIMYDRLKSGGGAFSSSVLDAKGQSSIAYIFFNSMVYRVYSMNKSFTDAMSSSETGALGAKVEGFKGTYEVETAIADGVNSYPGIYWSYMVTFLGITQDAEGNLSSMGMGFSNKHLPSMPLDVSGSDIDLNGVFSNSGIVSSEARTMEEKQKDILDKVYGLLSEDANSYRDRLTKSTQDSYILQMHRSIVGTWANDTLSVSAGGNQSYASVVGYINTPTLSDLPITQWILKDYVYVYLILLLVAIIIIVTMVFTGARTVRGGVGLFLLIAVLLILPQYAVNTAVGVTNSISNKIYSDRFNYWVITQHQQTIVDLASARNTGDDLDYLVASNLSAAKQSYSTDVGVRIKWMAPKRDDVFNSLFSKKSLQGLDSDLTLFRWLFSSYFNQEEYVFNNTLATYIYRPYISIANEARDSYTDMFLEDIDKVDIIGRIDVYKDGVPFLPEYRFDGMTVNKETDERVEYTQQTLDLIDSVTRYAKGGTGSPDIYRYWPISNPDVTKAVFRTDFDSSNAGISGDIDGVEYNAFALATESPYYYFYNALKYNYAENGSFKNALLEKRNFRVSSDNDAVDGKVRDFLDMEGLFTYVIPYLQQGNEYVHEWTRRYGTDVDGFDFDSGGFDESEASDEVRDQFIAAKEKKENLRNVWKLYSPWVDSLYNGKVLNEKIKVGSRRFTVLDGASPSAYRDLGRDMIFSEADMRAKNYRSDALSEVEYNIQKTLKDTYIDLMYLTNYYDFDDEALLSAAAMMATFNFDRNFSTYNFLTGGTQIYPQGFELKNFNYDAFMRLTLLNATGEPLMADKDLYARIIAKTGLPTGVLLVLDDVLAVYVIPVMKVIILFVLALLCFATVFSMALSPPQKLVRALWSTIGVPLVLFMVGAVSFAYVISLIMGEGLTGYVGGRAPMLGVSDPTMILLLIFFVDLLFIGLLGYLVFRLFKSLKTSVVGVALVASAGVAQAMTGVVGKALKGLTQAGRDTSGVRGSGGERWGRSSSSREGNSTGEGTRSRGSLNEGRNVASAGAGTENAGHKRKRMREELDRLAAAPAAGSVEPRVNTYVTKERETVIDGKSIHVQHLGGTGTGRKGVAGRINDLYDRVGDARLDAEKASLARTEQRLGNMAVGSSRTKQLGADYAGRQLLYNIERANRAMGKASKGAGADEPRKFEYKDLTGKPVDKDKR